MASNVTLRGAFEHYNTIDRDLYSAAVVLFCAEFRRALVDTQSCVADFMAGKGTKEGTPAICANVTADATKGLDAAYPPFAANEGARGGSEGNATFVKLNRF